MELPKNITQIGESDKHCKIYVEDYVVSYIKQINRLACNKDMAVALYGRRKPENEISYLFLYGACKLDFLQRETRHLSQAQLQEVEKLRKKHFADYEFLGYRLLNGEMVDGFHIFEQGICRYTAGYAQFYEKNDAMLAYMLSARELDKEPEAVDREKYDTVKKRQEERREEYRVDRRAAEPAEEIGRGNARQEGFLRYKPKSTGKDAGQGGKPRALTSLRIAAAAVFVLLGLAGVSILWDEQNTEALKTVVGQALAEFTEKKLPDATPAPLDAVGTTPLVVPTPAVTTPGPTVAAPSPAVSAEPVTTVPSVTPPIAAATPAATVAPIATPTPVAAATPTATPTPAATPIPVVAPASYTVQHGDTLIGISILNYGDDSMVRAISELNEIADPDDIKVGDKILLP